MECLRPGSGGSLSDYYLLLKDIESGEELARCAEGYGLGSLYVWDDTIYIFASRWEQNSWKDVTLFNSSDLKNWQSKIVIKGNNEQIFNTSVCQGSDGFIMAYESNDPAYPAFTIKFARSSDLENWTLLPDATFGTNRYTACPCIRYVNGWYYVLYLEHRKPRWYFETYLTRSKDLRSWELSCANPVLRPEGLDEGINASDPDIIEFEGKTYLYYSVGDQRTWMNLKCVVYPGTIDTFFESWYKFPGIPDIGTVSATDENKPINPPE
jgi:alpha-L-fucosidase